MADMISCEKHSVHFEGVILFSVSFWAQRLQQYLKGIYSHYKKKNIRGVKQTTTATATRTSPNKSFNEQNNDCHTALQVFAYFVAVLCNRDRGDDCLVRNVYWSKTLLKLNMHRRRSMSKEDTKISHYGSRSPKYTELSHFTLSFFVEDGKEMYKTHVHSYNSIPH